MNALLEPQESVTLIGMIGLASLAVFCLMMWVFFSHRMFGPPVAMRRHVQNLIDGDYSSRVNLRATDEFKDLAHDLNQLAEHLQSKLAKRG